MLPEDDKALGLHLTYRFESNESAIDRVEKLRNGLSCTGLLSGFRGPQGCIHEDAFGYI